MKLHRSVNVLSVGLLLGLVGSLSLNLYQLNERTAGTLPAVGAYPASQGRAALLDDLATYRRLTAHQDSLIYSLQHPHTVHRVAAN